MWKLIRFVVLVLWAVLVPACAGTLRQNTIAYANDVAAIADASGATVLRTYCARTLDAIGQRGAWDATARHCVTSDAAAPPVTPEQHVALDQERRRWDPVFAAHDLLVAHHAAVVAAIRAGDSPSVQTVLGLVTSLVNAYQALVQAAQSVGLPLPALETAVRR